MNVNRARSAWLGFGSKTLPEPPSSAGLCQLNVSRCRLDWNGAMWPPVARDSPVPVMRRRPEVTPVVILTNGGIKDRSCVEYSRKGSSDWSFGSLAEGSQRRRWAICEWVHSLDCRLPMTAISVLYVALLPLLFSLVSHQANQSSERIGTFTAILG